MIISLWVLVSDHACDASLVSDYACDVCARRVVTDDLDGLPAGNAHTLTPIPNPKTLSPAS